MMIILTHEQADFDALASLLGAALLYETAIPVLPRRMNRNVRSFLALYGAELPFIDPRDLPNEPIEQIVLVDAQAMVSLKGMSAKTPVQVIDHHPLREGIPEHWSVTSEDVGATTTLLVEALREQNGALTRVQATLLLLGIYEDTGSLTYTRTTARDLQAAAYLVSQGGSLRIANGFLNHPLSTEQQALYDRLRSSVQYLNIHGHRIVVACGDAGDMEEELSTVAHRMRDLLEPDAIFLLITTRSGVQMIARSSSDYIDVGAVALHFGGGGHERAAAGLIRGRSLQDVTEELAKILPDFVRPAITVSQIMSSRPQLLTPETTAAQAAERIRRFGYEGYPVVENGRLVGLLTRRAVDHAISHNMLTQTVGSLMEAGAYCVHPGDSVEHLYRLVAETGWGQMPVVDPDSGDIIGIVTRTDLLNTIGPAPRLPGHLNLADRLSAALPPDRLHLLKVIAEVAHTQHVALYIVGGFVRDLILERPSLDFDLVVEGDAIQLAKALVKKYGGRITSHARFGTAKWHLDDPQAGSTGEKLHVQGLSSVDLITARTEFYTHPSALPTVERGSIKLDLHRRDFTINTLALRLDGRHYGNLYDFWGGLDDIRAGLVRILHSLSFVDDPTRILRAVRFEQRLGFQIEFRTLQLLLEARPLIGRLSGDRIRHELNHMLQHPSAAQMIQRLHDLGLLSEIHPDLIWDDWLKEHFMNFADLQPASEWRLRSVNSQDEWRVELAYVLWFIRLNPGNAGEVASRLKLTKDLVEVLEEACVLWREQGILATGKPSSIVAHLEDKSPLTLYALFLATNDEKVRQALWAYVSQWRRVSPHIDGAYLKSLGIPPGPCYRQILGALRAAWLDGQISTPAEEKQLLDDLLSHGKKQANDGG